MRRRAPGRRAAPEAWPRPAGCGPRLPRSRQTASKQPGQARPLRGGPAPQPRRRRRRRSPATSLDAAVPVRRSIDGPTGRRRTARADFRSDHARTSRNLAGTFGLGLRSISDAARGRLLQSLCEGSCPQIDAVAGPVDVTCGVYPTARDPETVIEPSFALENAPSAAQHSGL